MIAALAVGTGGCSSEDAKPTPVDREVDRLVRWSAPDGVRVVGTEPWRHDAWSTETAWEIETEKDWHANRTILERAARAARYQPGTSGEREASFFKAESGDTYYLQVENLDNGPPLRVKVIFTARAG